MVSVRAAIPTRPAPRRKAPQLPTPRKTLAPQRAFALYAGATLHGTAAGTDSYNVYRGTASGSYDATPVANVTSTTSYTDTNVANGTPYYYVVPAVNGIGESGYSNEASATPQAAPPPTTPDSPTNVQAKVPGRSGKVNVTWTQSTSPNITQNWVYRLTDGVYAPPVKLSATTSYSDSTAPKGQSSCYEVTAVNSSGLESAHSTPSNCVTP